MTEFPPQGQRWAIRNLVCVSQQSPAAGGFMHTNSSSSSSSSPPALSPFSQMVNGGVKVPSFQSKLFE